MKREWSCNIIGEIRISPFFKVLHMKTDLEKLNNEQIEAVRHYKGPCLVIAGPGTGKTTVITHRVMHLIKKYKVKPEEILVVTFTKAAAKEMEARFSNLSNCLKEYNRVTFGTFHSIFFKILRRYNNYKLEDLLDEKEKYLIIKSIIKGIGYDFFEDEQIIESIISEISYIQNTLIKADDYKPASVDERIFANIRKQYEIYKCNNGKYDYDDMLVHCHNLLINNPQVLNSIRDKFKYILIDEFQDINKVQFETMKIMASPLNNIFIVGDDDQSIYRFRGADPKIMLEFTKIYREASKITLKYNYRSSKAIINSAMSLINNNKNRYEKQFTTTKPLGRCPTVVRVEDFEEEAKVIGEKIISHIKQGGNYSEFTVIYRTNLQSRALIDAFTARNIPYISYDGLASVYNHWVFTDIMSYLKASCGIEKNNSLLRILNKPNRFISRAAIENAINKDGDLIDNIVKSGTMNDLQVGSMFQLKESLLRIKGMTAGNAVKFIRNFIGYEEYIRNYAYSKSIDVKLFKELLEEISSSAEGFVNIADYIEHIRKIVESYRQKYRDNKKNDSVALMTMHKAKGLEFEQVFIAGAVDGVIPYSKDTDLSPIELEDERRLFYVAMTRAKSNLFIFVPKHRFSQKVSSSRFLGEIDTWLKDYKDTFECGDKIHHRDFGDGIIKEIDKASGEYCIKVDFNGNIKKLNLNILIKNRIINFE